MDFLVVLELFSVLYTMLWRGSFQRLMSGTLLKERKIGIIRSIAFFQGWEKALKKLILKHLLESWVKLDLN